MTETDTSIVRRQIVVDAPITAAFETFTARFGEAVEGTTEDT